MNDKIAFKANNSEEQKLMQLIAVICQYYESESS